MGSPQRPVPPGSGSRSYLHAHGAKPPRSANWWKLWVVFMIIAFAIVAGGIIWYFTSERYHHPQRNPLQLHPSSHGPYGSSEPGERQQGREGS